MKIKAHVLISGRVQGVFFRQKTRMHAEQVGVNGWVKNLFDGRVEAMFEGDEAAVKKLVEWCRHGPSRAQVENLEVEWQENKNEFTNFKVL
jgi:acylphosphatase